MRFLIVATAVFACAAAVPQGAVLGASYSAPLGYGSVGRLAPAQPTISAGDINGAAIEARVEASDHLRAAYDANRQLNDKVSELRGQAINNAEVQAWREVDAVKTVEARLDGAAAGAAPVFAKSLVRSNPAIAPVSYAAPSYSAGSAYAAAPVSYAAAPTAYSAYSGAPIVYNAYSDAPSVYSAYSSPLNYDYAF